MAVAMCFAEVGSRFDTTGGPYLYARAAFGRFVAFEVGWMQWVTRVTSQAGVANGIAVALAYYQPALAQGGGRVAVLVALIGALAMINVRGIRQSSWVLNFLTIGKLVPLVIFIAIGIFFLAPARMMAAHAVTMADASAAALLLIFTFGGYDVVSVPAGEARDPRRHLPFAFIMTIAVVTFVFAAGQAVVMSVLPDPAASQTPLADAAAIFMGGAGALLISVGSIVSMTGNNHGHVLTGSRMLFALAEHGELPKLFARIHPAFRTPANAVIFTAAVGLTLALSGSFVVMATASAVARLVTYTGTCAATLVLRRPHAGVAEATFTAPFGPVIPIVGTIVSLAILAGASRQQLAGGVTALLIGGILFGIARFGSRQP
jgi:APA family basic amino acid/polyamine antiporter